ncbi:uncharacterized protein BCR38DRAFT_455955 [Pseudomassariella vexata]|uniref:THUMP domain-containing protein n=1 Tax=Pseudomassariella vexata TaxID=1141098 RepID=A0A1Y2E693_9PEZI|nr:uncharacterized protein BCR38DRAFT_455955 [Pseudomassariella vexata]ORY67090.1 hypothetical protein BCR38DRAFT_455955 [Pseudomassariella vexata]
MDSSAKRKGPPGGGSDGRQLKQRKARKWITTHHKAKLAALKAKGNSLEIGGMGFWVTCQRGQEAKALAEIVSLSEEYGEKVYGIKPQEVSIDSDEEGDIEASIQKEIDSIKPSNKAQSEQSVFDPVRLNLDCLIFIKTKPPVEPCQFVRRICNDAKLVGDRSHRKSRFLNRLTPITFMGKATESGVEEVARKVLPDHFQLAGAEEKKPVDGEPSYAIRFSSRANTNLKRDDVIKQVATLIGSRYKVNLSKPDKVILIEIFQTFCGMSVVPGDWDALKKYNIRELYEAASKQRESAIPAATEPKPASQPEPAAETGPVEIHDSGTTPVPS